jgi:hypothetical protein
MTLCRRIICPNTVRARWYVAQPRLVVQIYVFELICLWRFSLHAQTPAQAGVPVLPGVS